MDDDILFWEEDRPKQEKQKPTCYGCHRELSEYLDAYYGKDDYWGRFCTKCRDRRIPK